MKYIKSIIAAPLMMVAVMLIVSSCSQDNAMLPTTEEVLAEGEILAKQPSPGVYVISKFIDTGDDETAQFNGYTFEFQADGDLIAKKGTQTFNGTWDLNSAETMMDIVIGGNEALKDLDDLYETYLK